MPEHGEELVLGAARGLGLFPGAAQRLFQLLAVQELRLQRERPLLQDRDLPQPRVVVAGAEVRFRRPHLIVHVADVPEVPGVGLLVEVAHHVCAEQRERIAGAQTLPEVLQRDRLLLPPGAPEQIHHLAVGAGARRGRDADRPGHRAAHRLQEQVPVRGVADHQTAQGFTGVEDGELAIRAGALHVEALPRQPRENRRCVLGRGHDHNGLAGDDALGEEA